MDNKRNDQKILGIITLAAGVAAAGCMVLAAIAVDYHFEVFSEPTQLLHYAHNSNIAYWFLLFDMAGYYLLLLPAVFYLHQQYKYRSPWVPLFTFSGTGYVVIGAIGAAVLAATWPYLMQQYHAAPKTDQQSIKVVFETITLLVTKGLWNILEVLFAGIWWIGFGVLLRRDHNVLGSLSIIAGTACLLDAVGTMADWKVVAEIGVNLYLLAGIVWPLLLGIHLIRKSSTEPTPHSIQKTHADIHRETYLQR